MRTLFLICSFFVATISTAQAATVKVTPSVNTVSVLDIFSVVVSATGFPETGGATLGVRFDPKVVQIYDVSVNVAQMYNVPITTGSPFDFISASAFDNVAGEAVISVLAPLAGALPSGNFDAFRIYFRGIGSGATSITLIDDGVSKGWTGADFSLISGITYNQANVTVNAVPLPAAAWLLLSGLGMLVSTKRFAFERR